MPSNDERRRQMIQAVRKIYGIKKEWLKDRNWLRLQEYYRTPYSSLLDLIDKLWHTVFGRESNGLHWFAGSSSSNSLTSQEPLSPWELGVMPQLGRVYHDIQEPEEAFKPSREDEPYNALRSFCSIGYLLRDYSSQVDYAHDFLGDSYVFRIYEWLEEIVYALRRYNDDFRQGYSSLDDLTSRLLGECHALFSQNESFARAYILHEILKMLYSNSYPYSKKDWDVVTSLLDDNAFHHDFAKALGRSLDDLAKIHTNLIKVATAAKYEAVKQGGRKHGIYGWEKNPAMMEARLMIMVEFAVKSLHYEHIRNKIIDAVAKSPLKGCLPRLKRRLNELVKNYEKEKDQEFRADSKRRIVDYSNAYGPSCEADMWDYYESLERADEPKPVKKARKTTKATKKSAKKKKR